MLKTGDKVYCYKNCIREKSISGQLGYTMTKYLKGRYYVVAGPSSKKIDSVAIYDGCDNHSFFILKQNRE